MTSSRAQVYLWAAQRISAMVLGVCVLVHLITMIYAVRGGLSAAEILGRTRGSFGWAAFYATFVLAVSVHAAIGLRSILSEWLGVRGKALGAIVHLVALLLVVFGLRAVWAVVG
ncbi:MAG: succinate dehydrogenase [Betaproteobacteria bacterium]|nr:MAG: succinate dehydrogenase [Betaproteobacteria bacterium]